MYHKRIKLFICPKSNTTFMLIDFAYVIFFIIRLTHNSDGAVSNGSGLQTFYLCELMIQE